MINEQLSEIAEEVIEHRSDAKELLKSKNLWMYVSWAATATAANVGAWLHLGMGFYPFLAFAITGFVMFCISVLFTMMRPDVKVPEWVVSMCQMIIAWDNSK